MLAHSQLARGHGLARERNARLLVAHEEERVEGRQPHPGRPEAAPQRQRPLSPHRRPQTVHGARVERLASQAVCDYAGLDDVKGRGEAAVHGAADRAAARVGAAVERARGRLLLVPQDDGGFTMGGAG